MQNYRRKNKYAWMTSCRVEPLSAGVDSQSFYRLQKVFQTLHKLYFQVFQYHIHAIVLPMNKSLNMFFGGFVFDHRRSFVVFSDQAGLF